MLTLFNSVDFQPYTQFLRSGILSVEWDWGAIIGIPMEGDVLAASLNLEREFFISPESVVSALNALDISNLEKTALLVGHIIRTMPWPLVCEIPIETIQGLAHVLLGQVNGNFTNFLIEGNNNDARIHYLVIDKFRIRIHLYITYNGPNQFLGLAEVFAYIIGQSRDL